MNWKGFILGVSAGFAGAYAVQKSLQQMKVDPEKVLAEVKRQFKTLGPIDGSWIMMKPESYHKPPLQYEVYKGGISRTANGMREQFEFVADAKTGALLDLNKIGVK